MLSTSTTFTRGMQRLDSSVKESFTKPIELEWFSSPRNGSKRVYYGRFISNVSVELVKL
jgi:hypothetical protein